MRVAYFDCFSGAAGDMIVAALIDAGADVERLRAALDGLKVDGFRIAAEKISKQGLSATRFTVSTGDTRQPHRHLKHVVEIIHGSNLPAGVREKAVRIFTRLAQAEARVHNTTVEKVHFHEVGAVDAVVDVVGALLALEGLGVEKVHCSPIPVGCGTVRSDHGIMPVPAPATAELLTGVPIAASDEPSELTTPTGAAILTTLADSYGPLPAMTATRVGCGAGTREGKTRPNVLRVFIGEAAATASPSEFVSLLETNIDDATPQQIAHCVEALISAGVLDAWTLPIFMKKQRVGVQLGVLCRPADAAAMEGIIFSQTPTLGIRRSTIERVVLPRNVETVETRFGPIRVKIGTYDQTLKASAEYDDCHEAAQRHGAPLHEVMSEALAVWRNQRARTISNESQSGEMK